MKKHILIALVAAAFLSLSVSQGYAQVAGGSGSGGGGGTGDASAAKQDTGNASLAAINTAIGAKTDAKSTATDTTSVSAMQVLKQISASTQAPSLPSGASTAANQSTANTTLSTIATNTTGASTAANQTSVIGTKAAGTAAASAVLTGAVYNSTPPAPTNGQQTALQANASGALKVDVTTATGVADGTAKASLSYSPVNGVAETTPSTCTTDTGCYLSQNPANRALRVEVQPPTVGGTTAYGLQSAASTNSTNVKASAGVLTAMNLLNTSTTVYYVRMYNLASAPTCSSATGYVRTWPVPPAAAAGGVGGIAADLGTYGTSFSTGISFCVTGGPSSTDNTNAATGVFVNLDYK